MRNRRPIPRASVPPFAQVGRPVAGPGDLWSRPLILMIAIGIFVAFLSLLWELQHHEHLRVVEVSFMEEEAAEAEAAIDAAAGKDAAAEKKAAAEKDAAVNENAAAAPELQPSKR